MNNDLISREALKKAMRKAKKGHYSAFSDVTLQSIYKVIDNAPTVIDHSSELGHNVGYFVNDDSYRKYYERGSAE